MKKLTSSYAKELLSYNPESGLLTWNYRHRDHFKNKQAHSAWNTKYAGRTAGYINNNDSGYVIIAIDNVRYLAHRVAWLITHGSIPESQIDHINGRRSDNRLSNLRCVNHLDNNKNASIRIDNTSGCAGVTWNNGRGKWQAQISLNGKTRYLGLFSEISEAVLARKEAESQFDFHENHGKPSSR